MSRKVGVAVIIAVIALGCAISLHFTQIPTEVEREPLRITFKDTPEATLLDIEPTTIEILLQRDDGSWVKIWEDPAGKTLTLRPGDPPQTLDVIEEVPAGTYIASRIRFKSFAWHQDANGDNDAGDVYYFWLEIGGERPIPHLIMFEEPGDICPLCGSNNFFSEGPEHYYCPDCHSLLAKVHETTSWSWPLPEEEIKGLRGRIESEHDPEYYSLLIDGYFEADWPGSWTYDGSGGEITYDFVIDLTSPYVNITITATTIDD